MEVKQVLRMNGGNGETSYAKNSQLQNIMISQNRPITEAAIVDFYCTTFSHSISIADLGCSSGPNTLMFAWEIIEAIQKVCSISGRPLPEFRFFLNDLPGNDFNTIFKSLPEFHMKLMNVKGIDNGGCFIAGVPGTFYGRLFPSKSLDFVHSSSSLHWLSRVPPELDGEADTPLNKGKIYISKTSPSCVLNAYLVQFQKDFSLFLKSRSKEVVAGGRMVLSFLGRLTADPTTEESCHHWELLAHAINEMVLEGLLEKEKVDSFNAPYYSPSPEELESVIQGEGSFVLNRLQLYEVDWYPTYSDNIIQTESTDTAEKQNSMGGNYVAKTIRAVVESMLQNHFGEGIMDDLFRRFGDIVGEYLSRKRGKYINFIISLTRNIQG
ncbi:hypothetical protein AAC387_Pa02g3151 [Persea americana]